uniref:Uncharacterized protein n=1 Tax=Opuntia streptacantha TaxID=393608 RepID=A0A7C8Z326_OPUST
MLSISVPSRSLHVCPRPLILGVIEVDSEVNLNSPQNRILDSEANLNSPQNRILEPTKLLALDVEHKQPCSRRHDPHNVGILRIHQGTNIPLLNKYRHSQKKKLDKDTTDHLSPIFQSEAEIQQCNQSIAV